MDDGRRLSIGNAMMESAKAEFGNDPFVFLINKALERKDTPFRRDRLSAQLPHTPHGLNSYGSCNRAAIIPALLPNPIVFGFFEGVCGLDAEEVIASIYCEQVHQAGGRIIRGDHTDPALKTLFVADRNAAEYEAACQPEPSSEQPSASSHCRRPPDPARPGST